MRRLNHKGGAKLEIGSKKFLKSTLNSTRHVHHLGSFGAVLKAWDSADIRFQMTHIPHSWPQLLPQRADQLG